MIKIILQIFFLNSRINIEKLKIFLNFQKKLFQQGSNYSYAPASFSKNSLSLDLKKFNRILDFNIKDKEITVEAGLKIFEFLNFLLVYDFWVPQLPGYPYISLGGAVCKQFSWKILRDRRNY